METLGELRHRNILPLVGYCESDDNTLLVFKFMERGSLEQWLHDTSSSVGNEKVSYTRFPLSWERRIKIIRGVANGLSYLHGLEKPIVHRDISAGNILLDYEFEAQITHFGLARRIQSSYSYSTDVVGTMGYLAPEYRNGYSEMSVKGDVYSFGVLMLTVATGQQANSLIRMNGATRLQANSLFWMNEEEEEEEEEEGVVARAIKMVAMIDPKISRKGLIEASVVEYFRIACMGITEPPEERLVMTEFVYLLNQILL
ncbi:Receptor-like kinase [Quillaja saponaria]|uniref:Receptor-like kinase n=1 Tax=Quillaja saponaria TaxID=32244 RepID=A0AAD7PB91_QUISA|nr:Receptor-like kinase [Quillaja saponaria]